MRRTTPLLIGAVLLVPFVVAGTGTVAGVPPQTEHESGGEDSDIDPFKPLRKAIISVLIDSVQELSDALTGHLIGIFASYPDVKHARVLAIHQKVFQVSVALATAALAWIGVQHMLNRSDGVGPLIYVVGAVAFGAVAPTVLWYPVELARLTTEALLPTSPHFVVMARFTIELFLVALIDVFLLLAIGMIFVARDVYLMLGVALSPLIALLIATPTLRRYGTLLANTWVACLLLGPVNAVALDLTLALLESNGNIPHWLWALGGVALLFGLPLMLLGAGAVMVAPVTRVSSRASGILRRRANEFVRSERQDQDDEFEPPSRGGDSRPGRDNRFRRRGDD